MLLKGYTKNVLRAENNPNLASMYCFAELQEDIGGVLPYFKLVFKDAVYSDEIPFLTLNMSGRKISLYPRKIVINALREEKEADTILRLLQGVINDIWEKRHNIKKQRAGLSIPDSMEIFNMLPQSNCRECGHASCMTFSLLLSEGIRRLEDCPRIDGEMQMKLKSYLALFH